MTYLVIGVVGDILRLIAVKNFKSGGVACGWRINTSQLVVLLPEISLDQLGGSNELKDRDIAPVKSVLLLSVPVWSSSSEGLLCINSMA